MEGGSGYPQRHINRLELWRALFCAQRFRGMAISQFVHRSYNGQNGTPHMEGYVQIRAGEKSRFGMN